MSSERMERISLAINGRDALYHLLSQQLVFLADNAAKREGHYLIYEAEKVDELLLDSWSKSWLEIRVPDVQRVIVGDPLFEHVSLYVFSTYDSCDAAHVCIQMNCLYSKSATESGYSRQIYEKSLVIGSATTRKLNESAMVTWMESVSDTENMYICIQDFRTDVFAKIHLGSQQSGRETQLATAWSDDVEEEVISFIIDIFEEVDVFKIDNFNEGMDMSEVIVGAVLSQMYRVLHLHPSENMQLFADYSTEN